MKKTKKLLSALLVVCLLLTAAPLTGFNGFHLLQKAHAYSVGELIQYGTYPQSRVTITSLIEKFDAIEKKWKSYHYYSGSGIFDYGSMESSDYMQYADFFDGTSKYRAVTFSKYRPSYTTDTQTVSDTYQDNNGYEPGIVYYFLYEPITWRVLDPKSGLVMSEMI